MSKIFVTLGSDTSAREKNSAGNVESIEGVREGPPQESDR